MAQGRLELINEAKKRLGVESYKIDLVKVFDAVTEKMSIDYPLLQHVQATGSTVASQAYLTLPDNYRSWEALFVNYLQKTWLEPEDYFYKVNTEQSPVDQEPKYFTIVIADAKIYLWNEPDAIYPYVFVYAKKHPKSGTNDLYTHLYAPEFDETIILGVGTGLCTILSREEDSDKWDARARRWQTDFEIDLRKKARGITRRYYGMQSNFWNSRWNR